ncbi:CHASE2 domain-containing protein [Aerosakkonemataceae cyanobacterium BLCC-F154]|uniref:CHASE2 domain-containing protein n=1 Tax=Floridaenema fluviatile BLCC-F154 TaxID=3153640 RepID=A0ABV4Y5K7_9CYAN
MRSKLKKLIWEWRGLLITAPSIAGLVIISRAAGLLVPFELAAYDQFFRLRPLEPIDSRIVIVGMTESDIQKIGRATLSDELLAELIEKLKQQQPTAIGLDIFRDLPEGTGAQKLAKVFQSTPNLIGIRKVVGNGNDAPINPPPVLNKLGQVSASDLPLDADNKIRRYFLYLQTKDSKIITSFGLRLAEIYLKKLGIVAKPSAVNPNYLQLGKAVFIRFQENDGGYVRTNAQGYQILLNYKGPANSFKTVSVTDVLDNKIPPDSIKKRIVLIGSTAQSKKDFFFTPYSNTLIGIPDETSGVEIHANVISQILSAALEGRPLIQSWAEPLEFLWIFAWSVVGAAVSWKWRYAGGVANFSFPSVVGILLAGGSLFAICYLAFLSGWWIPFVPPALAIAGSAIAIISYIAYSAGGIRQVFSRYLTDEVVATLLETPEGLKLGGERRKITILLSDLRGFSAVSERLPPEKVVEMLNIYLAPMTDVIAKYQGIIDDLIGDAVLVLFGSLTQRVDDAERAIACAVAMQQAMISVNEQLERVGLPKIQMGIGINTGEVVVGNIGSQKHAKYTVIGSPINLASRIESYTVGGEILISEATLKDVGDIVQIHKSMEVQPKGFDEAIAIHEVNGIAGRYNLFLSREEEILISVQEEIPIEFRLIQGKRIDDRLLTGSLVKLSVNGGEVRSQYLVEPLNNIKIKLLIPTETGEKLGDLYAKVTGILTDGTAGFYIRFTVVPPDMATMFSRMITDASGR